MKAVFGCWKDVGYQPTRKLTIVLDPSHGLSASTELYIDVVGAVDVNHKHDLEFRTR